MLELIEMLTLGVSVRIDVMGTVKLTVPNPSASDPYLALRS